MTRDEANKLILALTAKYKESNGMLGGKLALTADIVGRADDGWFITTTYRQKEERAFIQEVFPAVAMETLGRVLPVNEMVYRDKTFNPNIPSR